MLKSAKIALQTVVFMVIYIYTFAPRLADGQRERSYRLHFTKPRPGLWVSKNLFNER